MKEDKIIKEEENYLTKEELLNIKSLKFLGGFDYTICIYNEKKYVVKRVGVCEPNKCKSACCKFCQFDVCCSDNQLKYWTGFGEVSDTGIVFKKNCNKLNLKTNKCNVWLTDDFPEACRQFPYPDDRVYYHIYDKCSFKFKLLYEVKESN